MHEFSELTPLYHNQMDTWGLAKRTRIWMGDGSYKCVEDVVPGDIVFGVSFQIEDDYLPRHADPHAPENFVKIWRPILVGRKVLSTKEVQARPWQLVFGDYNASYEARRLLAGADTQIVLMPLSAKATISKRLVDCQTALENPRVQTTYLDAKVLDIEAWNATGERVYRPTPYTGQPRGEMATIIPHEALGGQLKMVRTDQRPHERYLFVQMREIKPISDVYPLYQIQLQPDTDPTTGIPIRCNMIAQTPFPQGKRKREVVADHLSIMRRTAKSWDDYQNEWNHWVENHQKKQTTAAPTNRKTEYESEAQGQFYLSQRPDVARELEQFGIRGGFLNGGILIDVPIDVRDHAPTIPTIDYTF